MEEEEENGEEEIPDEEEVVEEGEGIPDRLGHFNEFLDKGNHHFIEGNYKEALKQYDKALERYRQFEKTPSLQPTFRMLWIHKALVLQALRISSPKHRNSSNLEKMKEALRIANELHKEK